MVQSNIKYALIAFNHHLDSTELIALDARTYLLPKNATSLLCPTKTKHWKQWIGTIRWDELKSLSLTLVSHMSTTLPDQPDKENHELMTRMDSAWSALLLADGVTSFSGEAHKMSGSGHLSDGQIAEVDIREYTQYVDVIRPFYETCNDRYFMMDADLESRGDHGKWIDNVRALYCLLEQKRQAFSKAAIVHDALDSFKDGKCKAVVGTAIARFVEATEAVLAMPRNNCGSQEFVRRSTAILGTFRRDPYLDWSEDETKTQLDRLYKLRNARNHGKGTYEAFCELLTTSDQAIIDDAAGRLYYLAERLARRSIIRLIQHRNVLALVDSRTNLESAWQNLQFP